MNKRDFLVGSVGSIGLASATVPAQATTQTPLPRAGRLQRWPDLARQPGAAQFERYVGDRFDTPAGPLTLARVETRAIDPQLEQFVLHFEGGAAMAEGVHPLRHAATGQVMDTALQGSAETGWRAHFCLRA